MHREVLRLGRAAGAAIQGHRALLAGECHALMYVVDATDRARLDEAKACLDRALGEPAGSYQCWASS